MINPLREITTQPVNQEAIKPFGPRHDDKHLYYKIDITEEPTRKITLPQSIALVVSTLIFPAAIFLSLTSQRYRNLWNRAFFGKEVVVIKNNTPNLINDRSPPLFPANEKQTTCLPIHQISDNLTPEALTSSSSSSSSGSSSSACSSFSSHVEDRTYQEKVADFKEYLEDNHSNMTGPENVYDALIVAGLLISTDQPDILDKNEELRIIICQFPNLPALFNDPVAPYTKIHELMQQTKNKLNAAQDQTKQ
jgi:hypothetical protein